VKDTSKRDKLCRQLEQFAAILAVLVRGDSGQPHPREVDSAVGNKIVAAEREMMNISRELIETVALEDSADVSSYVHALNSSRLRFSKRGIPFPSPDMLAGLI
jgi:hypothetical protein